MALTSEDLNNISKIVDQSIIKANLVTRTELHEELDRMESRLTSAISPLQRDSFSRIDDHEARIGRLEKAISK